MFAISLIVLVIIGGSAYGVPVLEVNSERIIGGEDAPEAYSPHMIALIEGYYFRFLMCGGSIITKRHILTAAHCIDPSIIDGKLSETLNGRIGSNQWNSGGMTVKFKTFKNHPHWDVENIKNDAGILITKNDIEFSLEVRSVALGYEWVGEGEKASVTGWGNTGPRVVGGVVQISPTPDDLQLLYVETIATDRCSKDMREAAAELWWGPVPDVDPHLEICTFHSVGHGMCNGDSGSALLTVKDGKQVGIVSWGLPCAIGAPDIFTRIAGVRDFLEDVLNESLTEEINSRSLFEGFNV
ncbi:chymotrypsin-2 [Bombyx mori]|uniref:Peptidase S1 domain-containing protein n=1 Tax=Bombyx mori TaxID=7091 RepID=A0A8R2AKE8_BOMMO|nr:chymotrypsin-2 [Bombyx mori]